MPTKTHINNNNNNPTYKHPPMCRADPHHDLGSHRPDPLRILTTNAFYLKLKPTCNTNNNYYDSLTLLYPPRVNGAPLELNGSKARPESPACVTLHRVVNAGAGSMVFGSTERVVVGEGVRFEVYIGEERLIKGSYKRDGCLGWRVECACVGESGVGVEEAEVCVAVEGGRMRERVAVGKGSSRRRRRARGRGFEGLEEIPEEEGAWDNGEVLCCGSEEYGTAEEEAEMELEMEGVRWAVDVGIWVVCLGVGYLVSRASAKTLRRRRTLLS